MRRLALAATAFLLSACGVAVDTDLLSASPEVVRADLLSDLSDVAASMKEYLALYGQGPDIDPSVTVDELFAAMGDVATRSETVLDSIESAFSRLVRSVREAQSDGIDLGVAPAIIDEYFEQFTIWLESHRYQANPEMCRGSLPPTAGSDLMSEWGVEFLSCMTDYLSQPIIQSGLDSAERVNSIVPILVSAWS